MSRSFGEALQNWRISNKYSRQDAATALGTTLPNYTGYETDRNGMLLMTFNRLPDDLKAAYLEHRGPPSQRREYKAPTHRTKIIDCMCCKKAFRSWGIGNRLCTYCKETMHTGIDEPHNVVRARR